jgi:hypothetical protein
MAKTPVRFRDAATDPSQDEIPLRAVSLRPLLTCGVIGFVLLMAACGGLMFVSAQNGSKATPSPTASATPDSWAVTGTAIAGWTPTYTPSPTGTPTETPTATATLDPWDMTGTAVFWQTYTPTPTETPTAAPTNDGLNWLASQYALWQSNIANWRTQQMMMATVTAQAYTPTGAPGTPAIQYIEVTRIVSGGGGSTQPDVRYIEVTPVGWQPPNNPAPWPTYNVAPLPTVNPTYYVWLTWTPTPTVAGITPTASATASPTTTLQPPSATPTASATPSSTPTDAPTNTPIPTLTPTETATETPTETPTIEMILNP